MPPISRRFVFDKTTQQVVEVVAPPKLTNGICRWPIYSDAMAITPSQIPEAQAALAAAGVKTDYDSEGRPVLTDSAHRRAHSEALGFYDRNGGYSDPQRR